MRTISLGIVFFTSLLLVLKAVEAKSYFSSRNLAFQPRSRNWLVAQDCPFTLSAVEVLRGGAAKKTTEEDKETDEDEENDGEESDIESDVEEEDEDEEVEEDEYDADEYDDEYDEEEEEEETSVTVADKGEIVDPTFMPAQIQLYVMFGSIMISRKLDLFNPVIVKLIRFLFVAQLILYEVFIFYVRIMAKKNNDRTPIQQKNPLSEILQKQMDQAPGGGNDMVKNLASSFLSSETTVMEYDMRQASNMQGGILFNMLLNWFLHFKLQKTQPLVMQLISGTVQLVYNPLFQVYILGRNLERPFKTQMMMTAQKMEEAKKGETAEKAEAEEEDDKEEEKEDGDDDDDTDDDEDVSEDDEDSKAKEDDNDDEEDEDSDGSG